MSLIKKNRFEQLKHLNSLKHFNNLYNVNNSDEYLIVGVFAFLKSYNDPFAQMFKNENGLKK